MMRREKNKNNFKFIRSRDPSSIIITYVGGGRIAAR
jgi:hypothetical protein